MSLHDFVGSLGQNRQLGMFIHTDIKKERNTF